MFNRDLRDLAQATALGLQNHVRECNDFRVRNEASLNELKTALKDGAHERRTETARLLNMAWRIMWALLTGMVVVIYDVLKGKGIIG